MSITTVERARESMIERNRLAAAYVRVMTSHDFIGAYRIGAEIENDAGVFHVAAFAQAVEQSSADDVAWFVAVLLTGLNPDSENAGGDE